MAGPMRARPWEDIPALSGTAAGSPASAGRAVAPPDPPCGSPAAGWPAVVDAASTTSRAASCAERGIMASLLLSVRRRRPCTAASSDGTRPRAPAGVNRRTAWPPSPVRSRGSADVSGSGGIPVLALRRHGVRRRGGGAPRFDNRRAVVDYQGDVRASARRHPAGLGDAGGRAGWDPPLTGVPKQGGDPVDDHSTGSAEVVSS